MSTSPIFQYDQLSKALVIEKKKPEKMDRIISRTLKVACLPLGVITFSPPLQRLAISNGTILLGHNVLGYLVGYLFMACACVGWGLSQSYAWMDTVYTPKLDEEIAVQKKNELGYFGKIAALVSALALATIMQFGMYYLVHLSQEQANDEGYFWPLLSFLNVGIAFNSLYGTFKSALVQAKQDPELQENENVPARERFIHTVEQAVQIATEQMELMSPSEKMEHFPGLFNQAVETELEDSTDSFVEQQGHTTILLIELIEFAQKYGLTAEAIEKDLAFLHRFKQQSRARWFFTPGRYLWEYILISQAVKTFPRASPILADFFGVLGGSAFIHITERAAYDQLYQLAVFLKTFKTQSKISLLLNYNRITSCIAVLALNTTARFLYEELKPRGVWKWYVAPAELITAGLFVNFSVSKISARALESIKDAYAFFYQCLREADAKWLPKPDQEKTAQRDLNRRLKRWAQLFSNMDVKQLEFLKNEIVNRLSAENLDTIGLRDFDIGSAEQPRSCLQFSNAEEFTNSLA